MLLDFIKENNVLRDHMLNHDQLTKQIIFITLKT